MDKPNYEVFDALLKERHLRPSDVSKATGIDASTLSHWKNGSYSPKSDKINRIAAFFEIAPWAFWGTVEELSMYKRGVPVFEVSAGTGRLNESYEIDDAMNSSDLINVRVVGNSMYPSLHDGDMVLVTSVFEISDLSPNDFVCVKVNGCEDCIKHIEITDTGIWLRGENPDAYTDTFYTTKEVLNLPVQIIGKAAEVRRKL